MQKTRAVARGDPTSSPSDMLVAHGRLSVARRCLLSPVSLVLASCAARDTINGVQLLNSLVRMGLEDTRKIR